MDWCSVYLTPQGLPKYIYLSPPLIFPTTYNEIGTKNRLVWITPGSAPIRWMGPIRNPRWEQKRTKGYVIVSSVVCVRVKLRTKLMFYYGVPFIVLLEIIYLILLVLLMDFFCLFNDNQKLVFLFSDFNMIRIRYDNVTLLPLVLQLGLRIGPIQRMGAN
jgi:hypothetical protein